MMHAIGRDRDRCIFLSHDPPIHDALLLPCRGVAPAPIQTIDYYLLYRLLSPHLTPLTPS